MRAILPAFVSVGREGLPAASAGEGVHGFPVDLIEMRIPPSVSAGGGAELDCFLSGNLLYGFATASAAVGVWTIVYAFVRQSTIKVVSIAESRDLILRQTERLCNCGISIAGIPELFDLFFLFIRHG